MTSRKWLQQQHMATASPWCNSAQAVSFRVSGNGEDNNKNGTNAIVFHIVLHNGDNDNNNGNSCIALRNGSDDNNKLQHQT
jgi:hypothetical protein